MEMTIRYSSSRKEVNQWYWKKWREKLWFYHALLFVLTVTISMGGLHARSASDVLRGVSVGLLVLLVLVVFPQVMFKPKERTLSANENGIDTEIGKIRRHIGWNEISKIEDVSDVIVITRKRSGNAFIVPKRAFESPQEREAFYKAVKDWQSPAKVNS